MMKDTLKRKLLVTIGCLAAVLLALPLIDMVIPQKVNVTYKSVTGDETKTYSTTAHTILGFTEEHQDEFGEHDMVLLNKDVVISNGMDIHVYRATKSEATIKGRKQDFYLYQGTVEGSLTLNEVAFDDDDVIRPAKDERVTPDTKVELKEVKFVKKEKTEEIAPKEKAAKLDKSLKSGEIRRSEGKAGKASFVYIKKYVNGKKVKTKKKFRSWVSKPVDIQMTLGTSETGETGEVKFKETFIGNCTAYYAGKNATGAIGKRCHYGTCAVDPDVIPYGTKLYIEDYGYAVANDCGGAVKGHIIDLYMNSTAECFQWGRRNKRVYILE